MVKILLLFFALSFLLKTDHSFDQDLGRHIKLGEIIVKNSQIPKTNLFSYTNPDFPFINTHWLFEVLAYFFSQTGNLSLFLYLKVVIILFSIWLTIKIIPKTNTALFLPIGFIFFHVLRERTDLRPEIFSFLFTSGTYYILEQYLKKGTKLIFLLPLVTLLWINMHIYFFVGLTLQAIFLIFVAYQYLRFHPKVFDSEKMSPQEFDGELSRTVQTRRGGRLKLLSLIFLLSVFLSLLNPNGIKGVLYPLNLTKNYGYTIVENQTMFLLESIQFRNPNFMFVKISLVIIAFSLIISLKRKVFDLRNTLVSLFGLGLALANVRSFPYLVFLSLPALLKNFGPVKFNKGIAILSLLAGFFLIWESFIYLNGDYYRSRDENSQVNLQFKERGKEALDFVLVHNLPGPIFNNFDIGSYIIYRGYPKYQVFVDGRPESYPKEFFQNTYIPAQSDYSRFKDFEKQFGFKTIIFSHTDQTPWGRNFLQNVAKDKDWKVAYLDDFMIILVKSEVFNNLPQIDLSKLTPNSFNYLNHVSFLRLALFLLLTDNADSAGQFATRALQIFPNSPTANALFNLKSTDTIFW
ncbi:hypothetical protein HY384_03415 [Candidatus Daviesbacteria bacterium]|nr:hypothetical protein [Candidatus Daviesbacteria bacterium]